jgi:D-arabinose 1-dehydrogenase-like Zn-dependent alcohol dehydrogenase
MKKLCISGSRNLTVAQYMVTKKGLEIIFEEYAKNGEWELIVGCASGVDAIARQVAKTKGLKVTVYRANWSEYKKAAGPIRNRQMASEADLVVAIWNGESKGTADMIKAAKAAERKTITIPI